MPGKDPDQPGHPPSRIRVFSAFLDKVWVLSCSYGHSADWSDWGMARLTRVFSGSTCHFIGFIMLLLKYFLIFFRI